MPPELVRTWSAELHVRAGADGGSERIIEGVVIPFGQAIEVQDDPSGPRYRETIARGAVDGLDPSRVSLEYLPTAGRSYNTHDGAVLVGRAISSDVGPDALRMAFRVSRTAAGDELLELARDGVIRDLSAVFQPGASRTLRDGTVERTRIDVRRVAAVNRGAYDAPITAVRAATEGVMPANTTPPAGAADTEDTEGTEGVETTPPAAGERRPNRTRVTVDVERAQADREDRARADAERDTGAELARRGSSIRITRPEAVYGPNSDHGFLRDGWLASRGDSEAAGRVQRHQALLAETAQIIERAAAWDAQSGELHRSSARTPFGELSRAGDVLSSEIPGAYPSDYLPGLLTPRILKGRPMGSFYNRFPIADARPRIFPKVTTSTTVAVQSAEGAALSSTDFATTAVTATPLIYGAYTDVSRQTIDGADPSAQAMLLQDLIEAYSQASEAVIKTAVEAGSTASGVAITAATPYAGAIANVVNYYGTRFVPASGAFIPSAQFSTLLAQADTTGRPLVPQLGVVNSDGVVNVGGTITAPLLGAQGTLSWASTVNVWVFGVPSDFVIYESSIAQFSYDQVVGPQAVRIGIWAYLVVGTRLGSLKVTAA